MQTGRRQPLNQPLLPNHLLSGCEKWVLRSHFDYPNYDPAVCGHEMGRVCLNGELEVQYSSGAGDKSWMTQREVHSSEGLGFRE